ncbi:choice-of-anchor D domain-containing protein [Wenzhouxiangella marina]|nr:choice-of-anchor D domain-containing protein [Wenzhouxiangella marina]
MTGNYGIYIGGSFANVGGQARTGVARLNYNGLLDTGFVPPDFSGSVRALAVQDDGKLLVAGSIGIAGQIPARRLYRLNEDGSVDNSFQAAGLASGVRTVLALEIEDDGRILVAGEVDGDGFVLRLNADGSLDGDYEPPSLNGPVYALDLLPDGRALIGGDFTSGVGPRSRIARLNEDGSVDNGFAPLVNPNAAVRTVLVQDDGAVLLGGAFNQITGLGRNRLARLDALGRIDQAQAEVEFAPSDIEAPRTIALQADGRILVGGSFTHINGTSRRLLARLHPNGSLDSSFAPVIGGVSIYAIAVQRDGRILVGGWFETVNGTPRSRLARLHPDGSLDTSFNAGLIAGNLPKVNSIHILDDGKILIGGRFTEVNEQARLDLARLHPDGSLDTNFSPSWTESQTPLTLKSLAVDDNGWVYTCGEGYASQDRLVFARFTPSGQLWSSFDPPLAIGVGQHFCRSIVIDDHIVVGGRIQYSFGGNQYGWSLIDQNGNHTVASPFEGGRVISIQKTGSGYLAAGNFLLNEESKHLALLNHAGNALRPGVQPWSAGSVELFRDNTTLQMTPDGRVLLGIDDHLHRLANPDGLPLRQRIVWGTPGNPERLVWDRMTGFGSAPALLGTPRVLVSQTCCDEDDFAPAAGGGWMSRDGDDWRLEGFAGLPGKFYVRIEYRAGNSKGSSTFLTPIQRLYGEVPPGVDTADLSLKLVIDQDPVEPGDVVIVDVLAGNAGPDLAGLPSVTIDLPAGYTLIDFDDSDQGTFLPGDRLWKLDDLAGSGPAAGAQLRLQLQVTQQTPHTIEAQIFASEFDPNLNNNVATLTPDVLRSRSDLKLVHSVSPAAALPGDQVTFAVLVDNLGPEPADGVEVAHLLPTGYSYQGHNSDLGSYNSATGQWQIGSLEVGEGAVLEVEVLVNGAGGFTSSASASSFSEDPEPFNNLAFAEVDPFTDLAVSIEADAEWAGMGDALAMTVEVSNAGPRAADAVSVQVTPLSGGFIPQEYFASIGDYEPNSGLWTVGSLQPGETAVLVIDGTPGFVEDTGVGATVSSAAFDLDPSNNSDDVLVRYQFPGAWGEVSPASIDFGEVMVGQSSDSVVITVTSVGDEPLDMGFTTLWGDDDVHFVFDGGSCTPSSPPLNVGETCIVSLRFVPEAAGTWTDAEVRISSNDPNGTYVIPVSGIGLPDTVEDAIFSDRFQGFQ